MGYTDAAALEYRVGDQWLALTDRDGDDVADAALVDGALAHADAVIDAILGGATRCRCPPTR